MYNFRQSKGGYSNENGRIHHRRCTHRYSDRDAFLALQEICMVVVSARWAVHTVPKKEKTPESPRWRHMS